MGRAAGSARAAIRAMRLEQTSQAGVWPAAMPAPQQQRQRQSSDEPTATAVEPPAAGSAAALAALQRLRESLPLSEPQVTLTPCAVGSAGVWVGRARQKPTGRQQDWILRCLQAERAHPLAAYGVATLCNGSPKPKP
jgi:hypothetical protein